jgi:hypothetical protein
MRCEDYERGTRNMNVAEIEKSLAVLNRRENTLLEKLDIARSHLTIKCHCGRYHKIKDLKAIQDYYYTEPHGCTGGDYWSQSTLSFLCPKDESYKQRLLFDNYDVEWELRHHFDHSPEMQFSRWYKELFREVVDGRDAEYKRMGFDNCYYVDKNRKKFGLVEKMKDTYNGKPK